MAFCSLARYSELIKKNRAQDRFFDKYPYDEDPFPDRYAWFYPHDVGCDETPHGDDGYDNAYCEVVQQLFNMGYRAAYPEVSWRCFKTFVC